MAERKGTPYPSGAAGGRPKRQAKAPGHLKDYLTGTELDDVFQKGAVGKKKEGSVSSRGSTKLKTRLLLIDIEKKLEIVRLEKENEQRELQRLEEQEQRELERQKEQDQRELKRQREELELKAQYNKSMLELEAQDSESNDASEDDDEDPEGEAEDPTPTALPPQSISDVLLQNQSAVTVTTSATTASEIESDFRYSYQWDADDNPAEVLYHDPILTSTPVVTDGSGILKKFGFVTRKKGDPLNVTEPNVSHEGEPRTQSSLVKNPELAWSNVSLPCVPTNVLSTRVSSKPAFEPPQPKILDPLSSVSLVKSAVENPSRIQPTPSVRNTVQFSTPLSTQPSVNFAVSTANKSATTEGLYRYYPPGQIPIPTQTPIASSSYFPLSEPYSSFSRPHDYRQPAKSVAFSQPPVSRLQFPVSTGSSGFQGKLPSLLYPPTTSVPVMKSAVSQPVYTQPPVTSQPAYDPPPEPSYPWNYQQPPPPPPVSSAAGPEGNPFGMFLHGINDMRSAMELMINRQGSRPLPSFSGEPEDWPSFLAEYEETNRECRFSNGQKMTRLRQALKGDAKKSVREFLMLPDAADQVMETLSDLYGRPKYILKALVARTRKLPPPREDKPETIIPFSIQVSQLAAVVLSMRQEAYLYNPLLVDEIVSKLPTSLRVSWAKHMQRMLMTAPSILEFADWLKVYARAIGNISLPKSSPAVASSRPKREDDDRILHSSSRQKRDDDERVLHSSSQPRRDDDERVCLSSSSPQDKCWVCSASHVPTKCPKFKELSVDDRWKMAKEKNVCFSCLRTSHRTKECKSKLTCRAQGCTRRHNTLLHADVVKSAQKPEPRESRKESPPPRSDQPNKVNPEVVNHVTHQKSKHVMLKMVAITLYGPQSTVETFALLDDASTVTLISESLATRLGLNGASVPLVTQWTDGRQYTDPNSRTVSVKIRGKSEDTTYRLEDVRTVDVLDLPQQSVRLQRNWKHLDKIDVSSFHGATPELLIGQDHCPLITGLRVIEGPPNSPTLSWTRLGWALHGCHAIGRGRTDSDFTLCTFRPQDDDLHALVKQSFTTENFGVAVKDVKPKSREDERALKILEDTTKKIGDRYESGLLWRRDDVSFPESYTNALRRLINIEIRMDRDPKLEQDYKPKLEDYERKGYIRKLTPEEAATTTDKTFYLPHFPVVNPNKPGKVRLVFDCAAKASGTSLNDQLVSGPDLLNPLPSVLLKFRQRPIAITGDIQEMFHQVRISPADQEAQRFLWRSKRSSRRPDVFVMQAMTFGSTCSPTTALYVVQKNAEQFLEKFPEAANSILTKEYMDDFLDSCETPDDATRLLNEVIEIHKAGGFHICSWLSNSREVMNAIPEELRAKSVRSLTPETELPIERILGLWWDSTSDYFLFRINKVKIGDEILDSSHVPTKQEVLRVVMSVFDPLGFVSCFVVKGRILLQDIWREKLDWDEKLSVDLNRRWKKWLKDLVAMTAVKFPRCYTPGLFSAYKVELHTFVDASEKAFAAVAYLRVITRQGIKISLVMAKTRVAPLKPMSIPRLELQAAVLGSRLSNTVRTELEVPINTMFLWTDSRNVMHWIRSDTRRYKQFVSNRVGEILELTDALDWNWVSTKVNVADLATRDDATCDLGEDSVWINGPDFLRESEKDWPDQPVEFQADDETETKKDVQTVNLLYESSLPPVYRFSSWLKLLRSTAWMIRFVKNLRLEGSSRLLAPELRVEELQQAELHWIRAAQNEDFREEIKLLRGNKSVQISKSSKLHGLSPALDEDGVVRMRGRTCLSSEIPTAAKTPIILDGKNPVTRLIVSWTHRLCAHYGQETIIAELRKKFWIINIRAVVKSVRFSCQWCKVKRSQPVPPEMGLLPTSRVTKPPHAFYHTGMDYFGPMEVTIGRRHEKRWGVIFTCMSTRAVHIELAHSLDTDSCIMAIQRFAARRPCPKELYCDNGTNFRGAHTELKSVLAQLDHVKIQQDLQTIQDGINWNFIVPRAAHMGGAWERLIKSIKTTLGVILKSRFPSHEVLVTLLCQVEYIINNRPLTHLSVDPDDPEPLTPNHFVIGAYIGDVSRGEFCDKDLILRKRWRHVQRLLDHFWKRWVHEYLPSLTRRTKWHQKQKQPEVGDVVIIVDEAGPRNKWPLGRILQVFPGPDGQVRAVEVKTAVGTYRRPMTKICLLDTAKGEDEQKPTSAIEGENVAAKEDE